MTELTAHRTLALREVVANDPDAAYLAILHALCLKLFYRLGLDSTGWQRSWRAFSIRHER
jgi:ParB family chromosome partitioning protein